MMFVMVLWWWHFCDTSFFFLSSPPVSEVTSLIIFCMYVKNFLLRVSYRMRCYSECDLYYEWKRLDNFKGGEGKINELLLILISY